MCRRAHHSKNEFAHARRTDNRQDCLWEFCLSGPGTTCFVGTTSCEVKERYPCKISARSTGDNCIVKTPTSTAVALHRPPQKYAIAAAISVRSPSRSAPASQPAASAALISISPGGGFGAGHGSDACTTVVTAAASGEGSSAHAVKTVCHCGSEASPSIAAPTSKRSLFHWFGVRSTPSQYAMTSKPQSPCAAVGNAAMPKPSSSSMSGDMQAPPLCPQRSPPQGSCGGRRTCASASPMATPITQ